MKIIRKKKYGILVLVLLTIISIGYAILSTTLNITGQTSIGKSTWDVRFSNININSESVEAIKEPVINDLRLIEFEVNLLKPGDFYEFTVDVLNAGTIDAMIDGITKTPDLTTTQSKYLNYIIEYENGEAITTKQLVNSGNFVKVKVRIEYKKDIESTDLPTESETLNLGFTVNYIQSDGNGNEVANNGVSPKPLRIISGDLETPGSEFCIDTECFYVLGVQDGYIGAFAKYNLYVGNYLYEITESGEFLYEPLENQKIIQSPLAKGLELDSDTNEYKLPIIGGYAFSKNNSIYYMESDIKNVVDVYGKYISSLGYIPHDQGLMYSDILYAYGCDITCLNTGFDWLYSTSYWLADRYTGDESIHAVKFMGSNGMISKSGPTNDLYVGVRPALMFDKEVLMNN